MRLVESAWEEFTHISYADVSINKIIQAAGIPRGSFYQYFDGKEDLFFYLLDDVRNHFIRTLKSFLLDVDGDLFSLPMLAYDQFLQRRERGDLMPRRCIQILRINPGMDMFQTFSKPPFFCRMSCSRSLIPRSFDAGTATLSNPPFSCPSCVLSL